MPGEERTSQLSEVLYLAAKLEDAEIPDGLKEKIDLRLKRLRRMARQGQSSGEYELVAKYIDWCLSVPWGKYNADNLDINSVKATIDRMHYGCENVKSIVMEYIALMQRKSQLGDTNFAAPVLAFVGVQGAGKTSLAKAIAAGLGRPFFRLPLGGLGSAVELRGASANLIDGHPGMFVKSIVESGVLNPVILLDEFDKISGSESARNDFMAILLEVLDPGQNYDYTDKYIDYPTDLSKVMFIATANRFSTISRELLDRLEFIEFEDYRMDEKVVIGQKYLFPKAMQYAGLQPHELQITDDAWPKIVDMFGKDNGVRRLEQNLKKLARITIKGIVMGQFQQIVINAENAGQFERIKLADVDAIRDKDYTIKKEV